MKEILPGIFTWPWFSERHGYDFNGWFVREGALAIDPVELPDAVLDELAGLGAQRIGITKRNPFRAAAELKTRNGARRAVPPAAAGVWCKRGVTVSDRLPAGGT